MSKQQAKLEKLEKILGYSFKNKHLLEQALTHKSARMDYGDNERLEFLGDAVLQLVISDYIYKKYPKLPEGKLAKIRALLVSQPTLAEIARTLGLNDYLKVGKGEERTGAKERDSLLSDVYEAVLGAMYLEAGMEQVRMFILKHLPEWDKSQLPLIDAKSTLQEHLQQTSHTTPTYILAEEYGPDHDKSFVVEVIFQNEVLGRGVGKSKKEAAQNAAREALSKLDLH